MNTRTPDRSDSPLDGLARDHAAAVFRFLRSLVGDADLARDLVQDTFLKLHRHAHEAGPGLVFSVARSCALDHQRRQRTRRGHEGASDDGEWLDVPAAATARPDRALADRELQRDLLAGLATLTEDQRTVFHLSEIENRPYTEIATVLGVPAGTIASRKHHAVRRLRDYLERLGYDA